MKVLNLFSGPGAGKSTTAAGLFHMMKLKKHSIELITEFAKDLTWAKHNFYLENNSLGIFAEQYYRQERLKHHDIKWAVTDSPLPISLFYAPYDYPDSFSNLVLDMFDRFDNFNVFINRVKPYCETGRNQTQEEADEIGNKIKHFLYMKSIDYIEVDGDENAPKIIYEELSARDLL